MKLEGLGGTPVLETVEDKVERIDNTIRKEVDDYDKKENAPLVEKANATMEAITLGSSIINISKWWEQSTDDQTEDTAHIERMKNGEFLYSVVNQSNGDEQLARELRSTSNMTQFRTVLDFHYQKQQYRENVNSYLGETAATIATVAGAIFASPENVVSGGLLGVASKAGKLKGIMGKAIVATDAGLMIGTTTIQHEVDPENFTSDDIIIDTVIAGTLGLAAFRSLSRADARHLAQTRSDSVTDKVEMNEELARQTTKPTPQRDMADEIDVAITNMEANVRKNAGFQKLKDIKKELEAKIGTLEGKTKETNKVKTRLRKIDEALKTQTRKISKAKAKTITETNAKKTNLGKADNDAWSYAANRVDDSIKKLEDTFYKYSTDPKHPIDKSAIDDMNNFIQNVFRTGAKEDKALLTAKLGDTMESISKRNDMKLKKNKDGSYTLTHKGKKARGKIPAVLALSLVGSTSAIADDGDTSFTDFSKFVVMAAAASLGGIFAYKALKSASFKDFVNKGINATGTKIKSGYADSKSKGYIENVEAVTEKARLSVMETYKSIAKHGDDAKELVDKLAHNFLDGRKDNASAIKDNITRVYSTRYRREEKVFYSNYLKSMGLSWRDRIKSILHSDGVLDEFRRFVSDEMEWAKLPADLPKEAVQAIRDTAIMNSKIYDELIVKLNDAGIATRKTPNYVPRMISHDFRSVIRQVDPNSVHWVALKDNFANMIMARQKTPNWEKAQETADKYLTGMTLDASKYAATDDLVLDLALKAEKAGADEAVIQNILDQAGDSANRTKSRIDMDLEQWEDIDIETDGVKQTMTLSNVFERNSASILSEYLNTMSGHIALGKVGFTKVAQLDDAIGKIRRKSPEAAGKLESLKSIILGEPLLDPTSEINKYVTIARNLSTAYALPLVSLSLAPEMLRTGARIMTSKAALQQTIGEFSSFMKRDMGSELADQLVNLLGHGNQVNAIEVGFKGIGDVSNSERRMRSNWAAASGKLRDGVILGSQLIRSSDFMARINMVANAEMLAKYMNGTTKLTKYELEKFGITDESMKILNGKLDVTDLGSLKRLDTDSWNKAQKQEFEKIMGNMQQRYIQESSATTSPLWAIDNPLGRFFGSLMTFTIQAYTNHGLFDARGVATGDIVSAANMALWYAGGVLSAELSAHARGKELTEDDAAIRGLTFLPLTGIYGLAKNVTGGGVVGSHMESANEFIDIFGR